MRKFCKNRKIGRSGVTTTPLAVSSRPGLRRETSFLLFDIVYAEAVARSDAGGLKRLLQRKWAVAGWSPLVRGRGSKLCVDGS